MLVQNPILQFLFVALMSLWFFGWVGSVFSRPASSSRRPSTGSSPSGSPGPRATASPTRRCCSCSSHLSRSATCSAFGENFATYVLDAVLVIAITFLGSTVSAALMPWLKPDIYNASPIARYNVLGIPLITVAARLRRVPGLLHLSVVL